MTNGPQLQIVFTGDDPEHQQAFASKISDRQAAATDRTDRLFTSIEKLLTKLDEGVVADRQARANPQGRKPESASTSPKPSDQTVLDSIKEDASPLISLAKRMIPRELLELGPYLQRLFEKYAPQGVRETVQSVGTRVAGSRIGKALSASVGRKAGTSAAQASTQAAAAGAGARAAAGAAGAEGAAGVAAGSAAAAGPVGVAAAGAAVALTATALSAVLLDRALHSAAESLEDLSPDIASVRGQQSANMEMARLDRAQRTGQGLAQYEAARGRLAESTYEAVTSILEILSKLAPLAEGALDGVNVGVRGVDMLISQVQNIWAQVNDMITGDLTDNKEAAERLTATTEALKAAVARFAGEPEDKHAGIDDFFHSVLYDTQAPGGRRLPPNIGNFP